MTLLEKIEYIYNHGALTKDCTSFYLFEPFIHSSWQYIYTNKKQFSEAVETIYNELNGK